MSGPTPEEIYKSMVLAFRITELQNLLHFAGKNRSGKKTELQQRALDLVKIDSTDIRQKVKELSTTMYRQMGTSPSVNPYSRNYEGGGGGGVAGTSSDSSPAESPTPVSSPPPPQDKRRDREREKAVLKARMQIEKQREKERESILNAALNMTSTSGRARRSAAVVACANIAANIRDYNRSPDQIDIEEALSTSSSSKNNSGSSRKKSSGAKDAPEKRTPTASKNSSSGDGSASSKNGSAKRKSTSSSSKSKSKQRRSTKSKSKSKRKRHAAADESDDSYEVSSSESESEPEPSSSEEEEIAPPPITGPATTVAVTLPVRRPGVATTKTTTASSGSTTSSSPSAGAGPSGYRQITAEQQQALVEAEINRRRNAALALAAATRSVYQRPLPYPTSSQSSSSSSQSNSTPSTSSIFGRSSYGYGEREPVYPHYPDVNLKKLPFFKGLSTLMRPTALQPRGSGRFQEQKFSFYLSPRQTEEITKCSWRDANGRSEYKKQIQMRFSLNETSCEQDDNFPSSICVKVNNKLQPLPNPIPTNKPGMEPKRPPKPINITALCKLSSTAANHVDVSWAVEVGRGYTVSIYYVDKLSTKDLMAELKERGTRHADYTRALIKEKLNDQDCDVMTTSCKVTLACPLGKMRMTYPCRASTCDHLQCFDAHLYLMMNEKKPKWLCPVCNKAALFDNLLIDGYFKEVLASQRLPTDDHEIVLHNDGTWDPLPSQKQQEEDRQKEKELQIKREKERAEKKASKVETLSVDDDDDEEDGAVDLSQKSTSASGAASDGASTSAAAAEEAEKRPIECVTLDSDSDDDGPVAPRSKRPRQMNSEPSSPAEAGSKEETGSRPSTADGTLAKNVPSPVDGGGSGGGDSGSDDIICLE